jgi:hypothetical protein
MGDEASHRGSGEEAVSRPPVLSDLARLCAELNRRQARYLVVGGLAIIQAGYLRATADIDLLIETTLENEGGSSTLFSRFRKELRQS